MNSDRLRELDNSTVWHPFTAMSDYQTENAPIIVEGEGFHLIDADGKRYLDGHSSLWCNIHGHRFAPIDSAIRDQLGKIAHSTLLGLSNGPSIDLAAELVRRTPAGLTKVFYADCGAAGVEVALKLAYQYYQQRSKNPEVRDKFIYFDGAYHGDTIGTMSIGSISRFKNLYSPLLFPAVWVSTPNALPDDCLRESAELKQRTDELEQMLQTHAGTIAGVVIEPVVQAAAGIKVQAGGFLNRVRKLTEKYDVLLIADEIAVAFGRTGTMFACEHESVSPDILILSKGLTGGYLPLAATIVTDAIYEAFLGEPWTGRTFYHGHTYTGYPLGCAAALASLRAIDDNKVLDNARKIESVLKSELHSLKTHLCIKEIRQRGAMVGIELTDRGTPFSPERRVGHRLTLACRRRGVVMRNIADVLVLMPAPAMPTELVVELCRAVCDSVDEVLPQ